MAGVAGVAGRFRKNKSKNIFFNFLLKSLKPTYHLPHLPHLPFGGENVPDSFVTFIRNYYIVNIGIADNCTMVPYKYRGTVIGNTKI